MYYFDLFLKKIKPFLFSEKRGVSSRVSGDSQFFGTFWDPPFSNLLADDVVLPFFVSGGLETALITGSHPHYIVVMFVSRQIFPFISSYFIIRCCFVVVVLVIWNWLEHGIRRDPRFFPGTEPFHFRSPIGTCTRSMIVQVAFVLPLASSAMLQCFFHIFSINEALHLHFSLVNPQGLEPFPSPLDWSSPLWEAPRPRPRCRRRRAWMPRKPRSGSWPSWGAPGVAGWGYLHSWIVFVTEKSIQMDDLGATLFQETTKWGSFTLPHFK